MFSSSFDGLWVQELSQVWRLDWGLLFSIVAANILLIPLLTVFGYISQAMPLLAESIYLTSGNIMDYQSLQQIPAGQGYNCSLAAYHVIVFALLLTWSWLLWNLSTIGLWEP